MGSDKPSQHPESSTFAAMNRLALFISDDHGSSGSKTKQRSTPSLGLKPSSSTSIWFRVIFMYCWSLGLRLPPAGRTAQ
jgi:hypothetical protein